MILEDYGNEKLIECETCGTTFYVDIVSHINVDYVDGQLIPACPECNGIGNVSDAIIFNVLS